MTKNFSITLIQCPCWGRETPPAAISLLAGNLRNKGYKVHLFDLNNDFYHMVSEKHKRLWHEEEYTFWGSAESVREMMEHYDVKIETEIKKILEKNSQLVGFSVVHTSLNFTLEIIKRIKSYSPNTLVILGGPSTAEYYGGLKLLENPGIDAIILREGDETLPQVCADLNKKGYLAKIPGLVFKKDGEIINGGLREPIKSLDAIPFPDYSDFDLTKYGNPRRLDIFSSRSCINRCYFCDERNYFQRFRFRSGESLFEEVKYQLDKFPNVCFFSFSDSELNGAPKAIRRFSELLLENNIRIAWGGQAVIQEYMTPDLLRLMRKAGCDYLSYGVESGSNRVLKSMNKNLTTELAVQVLRDTHNAGIKTYANFMFGYPTETEEDFQMTLDFVRQNYKWLDGVNPSQSFTIIIPNTYLYENSKEFGVENANHHLFWSSQKGRNTYPTRFDRYERFCKLCLELGLTGVGIVKEKKDKWRLLGEYYQYKKDYEKAIDCYFKDLLKHDYSPESVKGFFNCYSLSQGKETNHSFSYQGINKLISLYNRAINSLTHRPCNDNLQKKIMKKILHYNTHRYYYKLFLTAIRIIHNEGWRSFFWKVRYYFAHRPNLNETTSSTMTQKNKTDNISKQGIICVHPFTSMCFLFTGNTYSCPCPNWPKHNIGNIKHNSISEIWNSDTARWIRRKMYAGEWQNICNPFCPTIIDYLRSNKFIKYEELENVELLNPKLIEEIRLRRDYLESPPAFFKPDTSGVCNLNCIMCSRNYHKDDPAMQKKLWADLKRYLPTAKEFQLSGHGEPLARSDTRELLINYKGPIRFHIITNGLLLPNYWEQIKHQKFASLLISTDAATKETYEKIRRDGRWQDLLKALNLVKRNRDKFETVLLNMTVMRSNYREISQFIDLAESYGFTPCFHAVYGQWGNENIFELKDAVALNELREIVINEASKKRSIDIHWGTLLAELNIPSSINLHSA